MRFHLTERSIRRLVARLLLLGLACVGWVMGARAAEPVALKVDRAAYGKLPSGEAVDAYTLTNGRGVEARVMTYGATLLTVSTPDREGKVAAITLHLDSLDDYVKGHPLFGSVVGRYANRIAGAKFTIDGKEYPLVKNAGQHHIHGGGKEGFAQALWKGQEVRGDDFVGVKLTHTSPDGQAGFPGTLQASVLYKLTKSNELVLEYTATTDKPTHVNLTNHAYFNLAGAGSGDVLGHVLWLDADRYLPTDRLKIPTGELRAVKGTAMDFTTPAVVGSRIDQVDDQNYDHCYVINHKKAGELTLAARVEQPKSGRMMEVLTTQPGVQLFTAKFLGPKFKVEGKPLVPYAGLCLETQHYPDSPNRPEFPSTLLKPGETYRETTVFRFGTVGGRR